MGQTFMDNASSTNKNKYLMAATYEVVQQEILNFCRVSFMVAGHTKFAPDQMFAQIARAYYSSDIFNEKELCTVVGRHATVIMDNGRIVRSWREVVSEKYSNLPGIRDLHDFLALRNPGFSAIMKVRETCYTGTLVDTPMRIIDASRIVLPTISDSYYELKGLKSFQKARGKIYIKCAPTLYTVNNFIHSEQCHELLNAMQ